MEIMAIYLVFVAIILIRDRKHIPFLTKMGLQFKK